MKKVTVKSPANLAFIKYWGRSDDELILPLNDSISFNLDSCHTTTTVEFGNYDSDKVKVAFVGRDYVELEDDQLKRVINQVNRIREKYSIDQKVKIWSRNNFPADVGIASSASAFSALTAAIYSSLEEKLSEKELSIETRLAGSGSACRSIPDGFVRWVKGEGTSKSSYAYSIAKPDHFEIYDVVLVVDTSKKLVGSYEGHKRAGNEYLEARLKNIDDRLTQAEEAILEKDIEKLGAVVEEDALSLHSVAMMSKPPIYYLNGRTFDVIGEVMNLRKKGVQAYFSMDAGPNVHVVCDLRGMKEVRRVFFSYEGVEEVIVNGVGVGARETEEHLF